MKYKIISMVIVFLMLSQPVWAANRNYVVVDRIEGKYAVVEYTDCSMEDIKLSILPKGVKEGDVLFKQNGKWKIDKVETQKRKKSIRKKTRNIFR